MQAVEDKLAQLEGDYNDAVAKQERYMTIFLKRSWMPERVQLGFTSLVGESMGSSDLPCFSANHKTRAVLGGIAQEQLAHEMEMCVIKLLSCIG